MAGNASSGRRAQPTALKVLRGNPGKRALNRQEPQPKRGRPTCPEFLTAEAKHEWGRIIVELDELGILTLVDRGALAAYCQAWARYREAEITISKEGSTFPVREILRLSSGEEEIVTLNIKPHPAVAISQKERQSMKQYLIEFGLTPASRTRIKTPEKPAADDFESMFGGQRA